ncbi:MAG TPA: CRISPR system precrRNA processing endoribonuclease RAMP protein Cas6 [Ktedonobacterales bacterium]
MAPESSDLLCAALLKVRARAAGMLPAFWGTLVQGAWLHWVEQVDPELSARLHAENEERPFTCSALWLPDRPAQVRLQEAGQRLAVQQGQVCWLRLTLLDGALFGPFARQTLAASDGGNPSVTMPPMSLNGIPFDLLEMVVEERGGRGEASWSGWTSYAKLVAESQARSGRRLERLTLVFDSPTGFGGVDRPWGRETALIPEPVRVFGGLARRWQRFAPTALAEAVESEALAGYLEERVHIEEYDLHTQRLHLRQALLLGFVGRCTYLLPPDDVGDRLRRQVHLLADHAFYAGVGHKTAQGLGRARRIEP